MPPPLEAERSEAVHDSDKMLTPLLEIEGFRSDDDRPVVVPELDGFVRHQSP